jgi:hypothetical protein
MKNATDVDRRSNVIPLSFKDRRNSDDASANEDIPHDIAHPASKRFSLDDPLADLLNEFSEIDLEAYDFDDEDEEEDYIFNHQKNWDFQVSVEDSPKAMADTIVEQIKRLKDDSKRIKYYLNELNLNSD